MNILGLSCFYHDAAAALLTDGRLAAAAEEERFSRVKHDADFPARAVRFCLDRAGLSPADLDYVVFYEKPFRKFERLFLGVLEGWPRSGEVFRDASVAWLGDKLWIKDIIRSRLGVPSEKILFSEHHLSHAASAFFCSPFDEAAVLTVDGVGEWSTATLGRAEALRDGRGRNAVDIFSELRFPHSVGLLYSAFTAFLGFEVNEGEYKVMGMAPYGRPRHEDKVRRLLRIFDDGSVELDMSYFSFHYHRRRTFSREFLSLFGEPRDPRAPFLADGAGPAERERDQYYADVAASVQKVTEEIVLAMANHLHRATGLKKLCLAGGVALNSVANHRLLRETPFEEIYIQPAAGDAGGALGAALYVHHAVLGNPRRFILEHAYWGEEIREEEARTFLREENIPHVSFEDPEALTDRAVDLLAGGKVLGWCQGAFEWGPRALGNRSILADPRRAEMKDVVNTKIKFREPFRPFAPSVPVERAADWFDFPDPEKHYPPRFMLMVAPVKPAARDRLPAVTHVDGTARLQTVAKDTNPLYHGLIEKFGRASGVPVLLNTSFNLKGEPMAASARDAFHTFRRSGMDALALGRHLITRDAL
ncbi:MAG: carbamoyltransferase family protein [Elusimicrobiota bacterium]